MKLSALKVRTYILALCCLSLIAAGVYAQAAPPAAEVDPQITLPDTFRGVSLGMTVEEVKEALRSDPLFGYRGDRDVSLLPTQERTLIETAGLSFIARSWFQFYDDKLYIMTFMLNPDKMDYYSMFNTLESKYGAPSQLSPEKIVWVGENITLSLERPLTVKYMDTEVFNSLLGKSRVEQSSQDIQRGEFLNSF